MRTATSRPLGRTLLVLAAGASVLVATPGSAVAAPPPSPAFLPPDVEALQPYVGQGGCDPVLLCFR